MAREHANGDEVSFALMGGSRARIKARPQVLFNTLLSEIVSESFEHDKVSDRINIVLNRTTLRKLNFHSLEEEWSI